MSNLRFSPTTVPNEGLRALAVEFESVLEALPPNLSWPQGLLPNTRSQWRRAMEEFVTAIEEAGMEMSTLPPDFFRTKFEAGLWAPFHKAKRYARSAGIINFVAWMREKGVVTSLEMPVRRSRRGRRAAVAGPLEAQSGQEDEERAEDGTEGDESPDLQPAAPQDPPPEPAPRQPHLAVVPPPQEKPAMSAPRSAGAPNPLINMLPSGYSVRVERARPGSDPAYIGDFPAEAVHSRRSIPAFLAQDILPTQLDKLRPGQTEVTFLVTVCDPNGSPGHRSTATIDVPGTGAKPLIPQVSGGGAQGLAQDYQTIRQQVIAEEEQNKARLQDAVNAALRAHGVKSPGAPATEQEMAQVAAEVAAKIASDIQRQTLAAIDQRLAGLPGYAPREEKPAAPAEKDPFRERIADVAARQLEKALNREEPKAREPEPKQSPMAAMKEQVDLMKAMRDAFGGGDDVKRAMDDLKKEFTAKIEELTAGDGEDDVLAALEKVKAVGEHFGFDPIKRRGSEGPPSGWEVLADLGKTLVEKLPEIVERVTDGQALARGVIPARMAADNPQRRAQMQEERDAATRADLDPLVRAGIEGLLQATDDKQVALALRDLMQGLTNNESDPVYAKVKAKFAPFFATPTSKADLAKKNAGLISKLTELMSLAGYGKWATQKKVASVVGAYRRLEAADMARKRKAQAEWDAEVAKDAAEREKQGNGVQEPAEPQQAAEAPADEAQAPAEPDPEEELDEELGEGDEEEGEPEFGGDLPPPTSDEELMEEITGVR